MSEITNDGLTRSDAGLIERYLTSQQTQYRLFAWETILQVKRPTKVLKELNTQITEKYNNRIDTKHSKSPSLH